MPRSLLFSYARLKKCNGWPGACCLTGWKEPSAEHGFTARKSKIMPRYGRNLVSQRFWCLRWCYRPRRNPMCTCAPIWLKNLLGRWKLLYWMFSIFFSLRSYTTIRQILSFNQNLKFFSACSNRFLAGMDYKSCWRVIEKWPHVTRSLCNEPKSTHVVAPVKKWTLC